MLCTFVQSHNGSVALLWCPFHCSALNDIQRCWLRSNKEVEVGTVILIHDCRLLFWIHTLILRLDLIRNNLSCVQMFSGFRQVKETSFIELPANLNCLLNNVLILFEARIASSIRGGLHAVYALMLLDSLTSNGCLRPLFIQSIDPSLCQGFKRLLVNEVFTFPFYRFVILSIRLTNRPILK